MHLVAVGTMAFDAIETPYGSREKIVGGAATFIGLSASYFTKEIGLISVVGSDFPKEMISALNERGISTEGVEVKEGEKSFFWRGKYHPDMNGRDTLDTQLNVLAHFNPQVPSSYIPVDYLMLGNLTPSVQSQVLDGIGTPNLVALDTMNFWMDIALPELKEVLKRVDLLLVNDEEARQLSGERSLAKAAKLIMSMGPKFLVIKKGEHGALLFHPEGTFYAPGLPLEEVVDPTGAGDTFAGGLMGYLAREGKHDYPTMCRGIIYGSAMASYCVSAFGTEGLWDLTTSLIQERVEEFARLVKF